MKTALVLTLAAISWGFSSPLTVTSSAFEANQMIPAKYTCTGENISPPITIGGIPEGTQSLALIMDDPDAPNGDFVHWVMWNIPVNTLIPEDFAPGSQGLNGAKENKYTGPCPPSGTHHYHFKVYALNSKLDLPANTDKEALLKAMEGHVLSSGELVALFKK